jgi:hypothetical protein
VRFSDDAEGEPVAASSPTLGADREAVVAGWLAQAQR